jgi:hypothetical protein
MKTIILTVILACGLNLAYTQDVTFKTNEPITIVEKPQGIYKYYQDGVKINVLKALANVDVCKEDIMAAKKHRTKSTVMMVAGVATMPIGLIIFMRPVNKNTLASKEHKQKAVELYNNSLK